MTTVHIQPGVCGFETEIVAVANGDFAVKLSITSACPQIVRLAESLGQISALDILRQPIQETTVYREAGAAQCHAACPVPSAIIKAIEVASGLALPADVHMTISQE